MLLGELQKPLRRFLGLPLKQKMRPFKGCHCHLRLDPSNFFKTRSAYKTVLFHLDIQDGYSNLFQFRKRVTSNHCTESSGQYIWLHRRDRSTNGSEHGRRCIGPDKPEPGRKFGQRNVKHYRREQRAEDSAPAAHRAGSKSRTEDQSREVHWIRRGVLNRQRR